MSRPRGKKFNNQDWQARKAEKQKQWEQQQAEKAKRQAEWEARRAARKAEIEARRKAQQELAAARKAERAKRKAEREKEIARKRAEIAQRKRERLERQKRELERLSNKSETFTKRVSFTAINDGKPYLVDEDARLVYGIRDAAGDIQHTEGEVVFEDATNPQELLRLGKQKLKEVSKPQVSYEADVVNLGRAGFDPDGVSVGDAVQIVDTTFTPPIRVEGRVLKIEEDLLDSVEATRITLGNIHESYTQKRRAQEQKLDALIAQSSEWNAVADGNGLYVRDLIGRVNEIMNGVGGYVYLKPGIGIIIYDKPENQHPTRAIQLGGGFWRTANSRKSNGDWDWKNIASGEGIFANAITTGRLMDAAGRNFWDMDTGEFSLQSTVRIGDRTVQQIADSAAQSAAGSVSSDLTEVFNQRMREELTQRAIFNKLTNNGETQGIYMSGGKLYLNAEYMSTGVLSDAAGLNRWNLRTGEFSLQSTVRIGDRTVQQIADSAASEAKQAANGAMTEAERAKQVAKQATDSINTQINNVYQSLKDRSEWTQSQINAAKSEYAKKIKDSENSMRERLEKMAETVTRSLNEELTQRAIFNKLTNNGTSQGIWLSQGQLYLNAQYLSAGIIADKKGSNSWNLDTGYLRASIGDIGGFKIIDGALIGDNVALYPDKLVFSDVIDDICTVCCHSKQNAAGKTVNGFFFELADDEQYIDFRTPNHMLCNADKDGWTFSGNILMPNDLSVLQNISCNGRGDFRQISCESITCAGLDEKFDGVDEHIRSVGHELRGQINMIIQRINAMGS
nr:MAG TPA: tail protein [Caudoviricetes sp.]